MPLILIVCIWGFGCLASHAVAQDYDTISSRIIASVADGDATASCGTEQAVLLRRRSDGYRLMSRPVRSDTALSPTGNFRVLFDRTGVHAPDLTDADGNGVPDYVDSVLIIADFLFEEYVEEMGYCNILTVSGRPVYDIYLQEYNRTGLYGVVFPDSLIGGGGTGGRFTTYMVIDNNFSPDDVTGSGRPQYLTTGIDGVRITLAHELYHAFQLTCYGDSYDIAAQIHEGTAVGMEIRFFPEIPDYRQYVEVLFRDFSRFAFGETRRGNPAMTGYTAGIACYMMNLRHGDSVLLRLWEISRQRPIFPAFDDALRERGSSLGGEWCEYLDWVYYTGSRSREEFFPAGADYPYISPFSTIDYSPPSATFSLALGLLEVRFMRLVLPRRSSATADTITLGFVNTNGRAGGTTEPLLTATVSISEAPLTAASQLIEGTTYYMTIMEGETEFLCTKTYSEAGFKPCTFKQAFPSPFNPFDGDNLVLPLPTDFEGCSTAEVEILTTEGVSKGALRLPIRFVGECPGAIWDGILPGGNTITNGVYLYVIRCGESTGVGKFAVIRR